MIPVTNVEQRLVLLQQRLLGILRAAAAPMREYDLLQLLAQEDDAIQADFKDEVAMFQSHFILFHCLYRLRDQLHGAQEADIEIHCLHISLQPHRAREGVPLERHDALRDYYLDWSNLERTGADDIAAMLDRFWRRYLGFNHCAQALQVLGLTEPVSFPEIKAQYRRLVMANHPDRGGDTQQLQTINEAMDQLKTYYQGT
ncbi:MAG: DnaJ domain-containing protein [Gammaproteobacteria bacterium]|nr:DnaJ domain-containing protein [Gammaproteobacteria bacterium]